MKIKVTWLDMDNDTENVIERDLGKQIEIDDPGLWDVLDKIIDRWQDQSQMTIDQGSDDGDIVLNIPDADPSIITEHVHWLLNELTQAFASL